jgi:phospholipid/cholesterol/gamma-HCH transport system permease protein
MPPDGFLRVEQSGPDLRVEARGDWTCANADALEQSIEALVRGGARITSIDMAGVREFDTFGAWLLERLSRAAPRGAQPALVGASEQRKDLLDRMKGVNRRHSAEAGPGGILIRSLDRANNKLYGLRKEAASLLGVLGAVVAIAVRIPFRPRTLRFTSFVHQLDRVGLQAVPIIALITFLVGCIISQQAIFHFRTFGAENYMVDLVGILVLRELGVLVVAIMVAGRSGSAYTAELGAMKMREEIDALRTMDRDPLEVLILPRILALVCATPMLLTLIGCLAALSGSALVASLYGGMSLPLFLARLREVVSLGHLEVGMIKAPFMALVIGVVACSEGLQTGGSAESLGRHTTTSVVKAIFLVIVLDGLFAIFFASIGM